ncbi:MAG TPA: alkaline phosphatase family protein [Candidatus Tumulicola sp.]
MKRLSILVLAALTACNSSYTQTSPGSPRITGSFERHSIGSTPIQHVIVIMQENRSFNNLFYGFPGAESAGSGMGHGKRYKLQEIPLTWPYEMTHSHAEFLEDYDQGKSDGFDGYIVGNKDSGSVCTKVNAYNEPQCWVISKNEKFKQMAFSYVQHSDIQPYWTMAREYALGDNTFSSNNGPTFPSHQYMVAGQSGHATEVPNGPQWGCNAQDKSTTVNLLAYGQATPAVFSKLTGHEIPGPFPCFTYATIVGSLDAAGVTWKYYTQEADSGSNLDPFKANNPIWTGPDRANIITPDTVVLKDIASNNLANVSWVTPSGHKSDHPGEVPGNLGPSWVASIVNAVGESQYWNSTAIIIMWDEWGGWFDPVRPKQYSDPETRAFEGLGYRVPVIVVSPYAKAGYVSHQQHEIASTARFIEETFGLPFIGSHHKYADQRADGFDDMFDFTQQPIPFVPIKAGEDARYFLTHADDTPGDTY